MRKKLTAGVGDGSGTASPAKSPAKSKAGKETPSRGKRKKREGP